MAEYPRSLIHRSWSAIYTFRSASRADLPLIHRWLHTPEVARWWGDLDEQAALLEEDLNEPLMIMRVVEFRWRPFACAQDHPVHAWPQPHLAHLPPGSRAIDAFVCGPGMVGVGHGSAFLRPLAERLRAEGGPVVARPRSRERQGTPRLREGRLLRRHGGRTAAGPAVLMTFGG